MKTSTIANLKEEQRQQAIINKIARASANIGEIQNNVVHFFATSMGYETSIFEEKDFNVVESKIGEQDRDIIRQFRRIKQDIDQVDQVHFARMNTFQNNSIEMKKFRTMAYDIIENRNVDRIVKFVAYIYASYAKSSNYESFSDSIRGITNEKNASNSNSFFQECARHYSSKPKIFGPQTCNVIEEDDEDNVTSNDDVTNFRI
jgi:hypothetical protein